MLGARYASRIREAVLRVPSCVQPLQVCQTEIELAEASEEVCVCGGALRTGLDDPIAGRERFLCILDRRECACRQEGENAGTQAGRVFRRNQNGFSQHIGIDAVEHVVALGDAAAMDHAFDGCAIFFHPLQDNAGVEGGAFYGGEEFIVAASVRDVAEVRQLAERLRAGVARALAGFLPGEPGATTISIGIVMLSQIPAPARLESLIEAADKAVYAAKSAGRNRVVVYAA